MTYGSRYQKKETPYGVFFFLLIILLLLGYFVSGIYEIPGANILNIQDSLSYVFSHPFSNWNAKTPACLGVALIIWFMIVNYILYNFRNFQSSMEHGDEDWLDAAEATKELSDEEEKYNRILTETLRVSRRRGLSNNNMLVIGSSGSFKTTSIMHQNLLQFFGSCVVLDVKGDTQRKLGKAFKKAGYLIKSLNFKNPRKSDRYNTFVWLETEDDMQRIIKALHDACRPNKPASMADPFWDDAVKLFLQALFYYAWLDARDKGEHATINDVVRLCALETQTIEGSDGEELSRLNMLMDEKEREYGADYPPVRDYKKLKEGASETVRSVILMINSMLSICETAEVKRIFSGNDIDIRELGTGVGGNPDKPVVLFLVLPDNNMAYNWIISMFYTQMFDVLIRLSDDELKRPLPVPVEVWMDEFYAGARPADPEVLLGTIRSRNITMNILLQSIAQLETLFQGKKWEVFMDNVATVVYLGSGPAAKSTHEFISGLLGETTIDSRSDNVHLGSNSNSGLDYRKAGIKLMSPGQVKRMPPTECIVFLESRPPIYDRKAIPFNKWEYHFKADKYLKKRYSDALALGEYEHPVYTIYDPIHFNYITVNRECKLQVLSDQKDIQTLEEAAKKDPNIYIYNVDEKDLLYLSWGHPQRTQREIEALFKKAIEDEQRKVEDIKGLAVLQDVDDEDVPNFGTYSVDKSKWDSSASLKTLLACHWGELSLPEQEEICFGLEEGLTEEQLRCLVLLPLSEMAIRRRAFVLQNEGKG